MAARGGLSWGEAAAYVAAQLAGGLIAVAAVHLMFDLPILQYSTKARAGIGQWTGELVATFGLILTIIGTVRHRIEWIAPAVALYIVAAYWFTSSTSFANPAITIIRSLERQLRGDCAGRCAGVHRGAAGRGGTRRGRWTMVVRRAITKGPPANRRPFLFAYRLAA